MDKNSFQVVSNQSEEVKSVKVDKFKFMELVVNAKVSTQGQFFNETDYPATVSILACSRLYGYFVAGHEQGFVFGKTKDLRSTFYATEEGSTSELQEEIIVPLNLPAHQIRLSCDEQTILVALSDGTVLSYCANNLLKQKKDVQPIHSICLNVPISDLRPNTGVTPTCACVLLKNGKCHIINWKTGETMVNLPESHISAIGWSHNGKLVICGGSDGTLAHYDLGGVKQNCIPRPESLQVSDTGETVKWVVQDVLWLDGDKYLALYTRSHGTEMDGSINAAYIIDQEQKSGTTCKYTRLDGLPPVIPADRCYNHFYMESVYDNTRTTTIILANGASNLISVIGQDENGNWRKWELPEDGMASLPLSEENDCNTVPLGLALDFAVCEKSPPYGPRGINAGVKPVPILYCLNDEGFIGAFHWHNQHTKKATPSTSNTEPTSSATSLLSTDSNNSNMKPISTLSSSSSDPFRFAMKSGYSGKRFDSLENVKGSTSPPSFGQLNITRPLFGITTSLGPSTGRSSSNSSTPSSSPVKPIIGSSTTNSGTSSTKDASSGFSFSVGLDPLEISTSTNSSSSSTFSYEMINKNDTFGNASKADSHESVSVDQTKSAPTKQAECTELDSKVDDNDQEVPTDTNTKKGIPGSDMTTNSYLLASLRSTLSKKTPDPNANTNTTTDPKPKNDTTTPLEKSTSPNAGAFSFGNACFGGSSKMKIDTPASSGSNAFSFATYAKKNDLTGTPLTSGGLMPSSKIDTVTFSGSSPFSFGDVTKKNEQQGIGSKKVLPEEPKDLYNKLLEVVEKMSEMQIGFQQQLQRQSEQLDNMTKNVEQLAISINEWKSMKSDQTGSMPLMNDDHIQDQGSSVSKLYSGLTEATRMKHILNSTGDYGELVCKDGDEIVAEMEYRLIKEQIKCEHESHLSDFSFDEFRRDIRKMEIKMKKKDKDIAELKHLLTLLQFREYHRKARYSQSTIAFEDLSDDDDDPSSCGKPVDQDNPLCKPSDQTHQ